MTVVLDSLTCAYLTFNCENCRRYQARSHLTFKNLTLLDLTFKCQNRPHLALNCQNHAYLTFKYLNLFDFSASQKLNTLYFMR